MRKSYLIGLIILVVFLILIGTIWLKKNNSKNNNNINIVDSPKNPLTEVQPRPHEASESANKPIRLIPISSASPDKVKQP